MKTIFRMTLDIYYECPSMPNFLHKIGVKDSTESIHIKTLTKDQAEIVANTMKEEFMRHWRSFQ